MTCLEHRQNFRDPLQSFSDIEVSIEDHVALVESAPMKHLFDTPYLSTDPNHQGLILHTIYHQPNGWDYVPEGSQIANGEACMWGDYHAREVALYLQKIIKGEDYYTFFGCVK